jgi:hypothetical protein
LSYLHAYVSAPEVADFSTTPETCPRKALGSSASASGEIAAPTQGQAFFYFGAGADRFRKTFSGFGFIR